MGGVPLRQHRFIDSCSIQKTGRVKIGPSCGRNRFRFLPLLLLAALSATLAVSGEAPDALAPFIEAEPSPAGAISWWLVSHVQPEPLETAKPPKAAREESALPNGAPGNWSVYISSFPYNDLSQNLNAKSGTVWATVYIDSATGGNRELRVGTWCSLRVYKDGEQVIEKPAPAGRDADEGFASIDLPKGRTQITVGAGVRSGFCAFYVCLTEGKGKGGMPRPVAGDKIVIPTLAGKEPDAGSAVLRSLAFEARDKFIKAGDSVPLAAGLRGSLPSVSGPLTARFLGPDGKPLNNPLPARTPAELVKSAWNAEFKVVDDSAPRTEVTLEISAGDKVLGKKSISLFSIKGLSTTAAALATEMKQRAEKCGHALPGAELAVEKAQLFLAKAANGDETLTPAVGDTIVNLLANAKTCAALEEQGKDPWENQTGYFERAYQSPIDGGIQPYFVQPPSAFSSLSADEKKKGEKKFPLVVFLHGYVPSYDKHRWWEEFAEFNIVFEKNNTFLALPFARSNADFQGSGEEDVLAVIAEMKRLYPIDEDRVYLYGYSMGGQGVYTVAEHYPDLFAAGIVLAGRADNPLQNFRPLDTFHPFKQWLIHADNPISLCENLVNIPLRIYHGRDDFIINVDEANRMEKRLKEIGCDAQLTALPGTHKFGLNVMMTEEPVKWLLQQKRASNPLRRHMKAYSLKYASQGGLKVLGDFSAPLTPIDLEWSSKDGKTEFTKDRPNCPRSINGKTDPLPPGRVKTARCCGPVRDATCGPFMLVYGTTGSAEANARNLKSATQFADDWYNFSKSRAIVKADREVTDADRKNKNLFLFGEEQENSVLAAAAKDLPIAVKDGVAMIGEKKVPLAGKGIMFIYPSPFAEAADPHTIVVCAGITYGPKIGVNHKLDLVPDFLLYSDQQDADTTSTNHALCAGFFDGEWKLNTKTMWWFE